MASPCRAIVPLAKVGRCECICCKSTSDQKAWGKHRIVDAGGDERREPAGDGCFECMDTAAERWPHEGWGQTAARIAGSEDERRRLVAMVAVRAGRQKPDFLPTSVKMRTSLTAKWVDTPRRPRLSSTHRASCSNALAGNARRRCYKALCEATGLRHIASGARF